MREIKFRAWDGNRMVKHSYVHTTPEGWVWLSHEYSSGVRTLMQYTGLKDKNKKEVYEKDIVKVLSKNGKSTLYTIVWSEDRASFVGKNFNIYGTEKSDTYFFKGLGWIVGRGEIIGNIYENKDLLK